MMDFLNKRFVTPLLCFLSGSLCALAMAPYNIWAVFLVGFGVLYWAIDRAQNKHTAFAYGWLWAFGYFVFGLYWIGNALLVEGNPYQWAWPLAVCGLPALLAFFNAFACLCVKWVCDLRRWHGYLGFAAALSLFEYARGYVFTGFPWNLYGYSWVDFEAIAQLASYESIYFLSFLTVLWLGVGGFMLVTHCKITRLVLPLLCVVSFVGALWHGGALIPARISSEDIIVKIVQPNTPQHEKWQREKMDGHFQNAIELSKPDDNDTQKTLIVWPETVLSPAFLGSSYYREQIADVLNTYENDAVLLTGALRREDGVYYNSLVSIERDGAVGRIYNKSHLVPFGEYIPFQDIIPLQTVTQFTGFEAGRGATIFSIFDNITYSPLICYEILFPHKAVPQDARPDFIVNVTNDAWYGISAGPRQHLVKAQFRAIEERIPVLRAANTGVSAIIDPYGRIVERSGLFEQHVVEGKLPKTVLTTNKNALLSLFLFPLIPFALFGLALANTYNRTSID